MKLIIAASLCGFLLGGSASAATLKESDLGDFSGDWKSPTLVGAGYTSIAGTWSGAIDYDMLGFTNLKTGAQSLTLSFSPITPIGDRDYSFSAGGNLYYQFDAPRHSAWEGTQFGSVNIQHWNRDQPATVTLNLGNDFGGILYLGLYGTYGSLNYNLSVPGNDLAPAPVPLPAGALLMRRRPRRPDRHPPTPRKALIATQAGHRAAALLRRRFALPNGDGVAR